jgi:hypothetical protein
MLKLPMRKQDNSVSRTYDDKEENPVFYTNDDREEPSYHYLNLQFD